MPFRSERQRRYLYANHPQIARRWSAEEKAVKKSQPSFGGGGTSGRRITDPVEKADWMGIEEHKRRSKDSRGTKRVGASVGAAGLTGAGLVAGTYPGAGRELYGLSRVARMKPGNAAPFRLDPAGNVAGRARNIARGAKALPGGAALGASLGVAGIGSGIWAAGRANENRHDRAISRLRRQRAKTTTVDKGLKQFTYGARNVGRRAARNGVRFLDETNAELKETFRPFSRTEIAAQRLFRGVRDAPLRNRADLTRMRAAQTIAHRPRAAGTIAGGTLAATYGMGSRDGRIRERRRQAKAVGKRYRDYNPEHNRQRRIGAAQATLGLTGAGALGYGGREVFRDTKKLRDQEITTRAVNSQGKSVPGPNKKLGELPIGRGSLKLGRRNAAVLAGGGLALAGASGIQRWSKGNRGRAYD